MSSEQADEVDTMTQLQDEKRAVLQQNAAVRKNQPRDVASQTNSKPIQEVQEDLPQKNINDKIIKTTTTTTPAPAPRVQKAKAKNAIEKQEDKEEQAEEQATDDQASPISEMKGTPVTDIKGIPDACKYVDLKDFPEDRLKTKVRCKAGLHNRSCLFDNLFFGSSDYFSLDWSDAKMPPRNEYVTNRDGKYGFMWAPATHQVSTRDEAEAVFSKMRRTSPDKRIIVCPDTHLYFHTQFAGNPGHGLWDGLYPAFMSAIRFGYAMKPMRMVPSLPEYKGPCPENRNKGCQAKEIIEQFGTLGMIMLQTLNREKRNNRIFYFERTIVGSGRMAQRIITADLAIPGSRSLDGMRLFRNHMFWSHGVKLNEKPKNRDIKSLRAFVVDNKRYTQNDRKALAESIELAAKEGMNITQIHWGQYWPFQKQLQLLTDSDIYITGPGTGMMLSPFMSDGSVILQLSDCFKRYGYAHPSSEEEYVSEGTPYMRAVYYNSSIRLKGLQVPELLRLYRESFKLSQQGFEIPVPRRINLSAEGRVFVEACDMAPVACERMLGEMNSYVAPWQCVLDAWASFAVYEVGGYVEGGMDKQDGKNRTCTLPRTEIRKLREKYASELGQLEENTRQC